jgi:CRP-like cAMP-binding protein
MPDSLITFLQLFRDISATDQELITAAVECRAYKESSYLFRGDKVSKELFFVTKGVLRILIINDKGNEVTHFFLKENQFCTILNSFNNGIVATERICAACDAEVLVLQKEILENLYLQIPYLKMLLAQIIQQSLLDKISIRNSYLGEDSTTRYKMFMMRQPEIALRVSLNDVASYLGITPQSLSRIRKNIR